MIGRTILHYRIENRLGAGGMGEVYLATDIKLDRPVALKFLPAALAQDPAARRRLLREARAASRLNHPNIVTIHAVEEADGRDFIVMEYVEGQLLRGLIGTDALPWQRAVNITLQICRGLAAAHAEGIIHRDIKPDNIIVTRNEQVRILDFGLAMQGGGTPSKGGLSAGTPSYMSPEQLQGRPVDARTDLFSVGVALYEMITGRAPFTGGHEAAIAYAVVHEEPEPIDRATMAVPEELERIVLKCLAKKPEERCQSATSLLEELREIQQHVQTPATAQAAASLAVLPFVNMSADPDDEYFSDGLTDELITGLGRVSGLRVVSRTSAFQFRGKETDIRRVGEALNVKTILEGSVRRSGKQLRVTAQLTNVGDGFNLWSERFDSEVADVFAIQDEIARKIVEALEITLAGRSGQILPPRRTDNLEAYTAYLKARYLWNRRSREDLWRAVGHLERALEIDPGYALAFAGLADCFSLMPDYADVPPKEAYPKAKAAAQRALELNPGLAEAHAALASILFSYEWDFPQALREFELAVALNPGYATAHHWYSLLLACLGRYEESLTEILQAQELDPLSPMIAIAVGGARMSLGDCERAVDEYRKMLSWQPDFPPAHFWLGVTRTVQGAYEDGIASIQKAIRLSGNELDYLSYLGWAQALAGRRDEAQAVLNRLLAESGQRYVQPISIVMVHAALGDADAAFDWLEKAHSERSDALVWIRVLPFFAALKTDPRFDTLARRIGLVA